MKVKDIKEWMIIQKRREIENERAKVEHMKMLENAGIKSTRKNSSQKNRDNLDRCYVRQLLRLSGFSNEEITEEMIEERKLQTQQIRDNIKKNGKYASESQKLSVNYLNKVINSKDKVPIDQITDEMREEAKQRVLAYRSRLGKEPKSAESRIKFQLIKRKLK